MAARGSYCSVWLGVRPVVCWLLLNRVSSASFVNLEVQQLDGKSVRVVDVAYSKSRHRRSG